MSDINVFIGDPGDIELALGDEGDINVILDGISTFQALSDTPSSYSGQSGKIVSVKSLKKTGSPMQAGEKSKLVSGEDFISICLLTESTQP